MKRIAMGVATTALALGGSVAATAPAQADNIAAHNLVNVQVSNLLNNNNVAVNIPIQAAANICGVDVVLLASQVADAPVTCDARNGKRQLTISQLQ